jgi:hypothetical protein
MTLFELLPLTEKQLGWKWYGIMTCIKAIENLYMSFKSVQIFMLKSLCSVKICNDITRYVDFGMGRMETFYCPVNVLTFALR